MTVHQKKNQQSVPMCMKRSLLEKLAPDHKPAFFHPSAVPWLH
jgi:hypothetical protein